MKLSNKTTLIVIMTFLAGSVLAKEPSELSFATTDLGSGLYMLSGVGGFTGGNLGLSIGDDGVILIDDSMPPVLGIMQEAIKKLTNKKIDFLINTHVHGDHTGNNESIANAGTHIVAHENLRQHMLDKGVPGLTGTVPAPKAALPVITFSRSMNFHLNGNNAHIFHVVQAHTDGDAVIHFKNANVIHTGDVFFNGMFPYIDFDSGGTLDGYIAAQQKIFNVSNGKTKIIPGHGLLASNKDLKASIDMLIDAKALVNNLVKGGMNEDEIIAAEPLQKYHDKWNWGFITTEKMIKQIYREVKLSSHELLNHSH